MASNWHPPLWTPPVGVGENWWDPIGDTIGSGFRTLSQAFGGHEDTTQADEERRRQEDEARARQDSLANWRPDPIRRAQEIGQHLQEHPFAGAVETVMSPFEAVNTGWQVAGGVAAGLGQIASRAMGGGDTGPSWLHTQEPTSFGELVDPARARAREGELPLALRLPFELSAPYGLAGKALALPAKGVLAEAGRAILPGWETLQPITLPERLHGMAAAGDIAQSRAVQVGLRAGLPVVAGLDAASEGARDEPWQDRAVRAGTTALGAALLGNGLASIMDRAGAGAARAYNIAQVAQPGGNSLYANFLRSRVEAQQGAEGGAVGDFTPHYQGGYPRLMFDLGFRTRFTDRSAALGTAADYVERMYQQQKGAIPDELRVAMQDRLTYGMNAAGAWWTHHNVINPILAPDVKASQIADFDLLRDAGIGVELMQDGLLPGRSRGENIQDTFKIFQQARRDIDQRWGAGTADKWYRFEQDDTGRLTPHPDTTTGRMTAKITDEIMSQAEGAGALSPQQVADIRAKRPTYVMRNIVGDMEQRDLIPRETGARPRVAAAPGINRYHGTDDLVHVSVDQDLARIPHLFEAFQKMRTGNAIAKLVDEMPTEVQSSLAIPMRPLPRGTPASAAIGAMSDLAGKLAKAGEDPAVIADLVRDKGETVAGVMTAKQRRIAPNGFEVVPLKWEKGESHDYAMPKWAADWAKGANEPQMDALSGFLRNWGGSGALRAGATYLSIPFLVANPYRHLAQAVRQSEALASQGPVGVLRQYFGAWAEQLSGGMETWMTQHSQNPIVQAIPEKTRASMLNSFANQRAKLDEFYYSGAAGGTAIEGMNRAWGQEGLDRLEKLLPDTSKLTKNPVDWAKDGISMIVGAPMDMMKAWAFMDDAAARQAVFKAERGAGSSPTLAAYRARNAPFDYAKGGAAMKVLNMWMPFVNVHTQATLAGFQSAWDDPEGFAVRSAALITLPQIATYAWNRTAFPDLVDKIPSWKRDSMFNLIVSKYTNPQGEELPITVSFKKDEMATLLSAPVEHFLDATYHTKAGQTQLDPRQRTERSAQEMWMESLMGLLPFSFDMAKWENHGLLMVPLAMLAGVPAFGTMVQAATNYDEFRRGPITSQDLMDLPPEYRATQRTSKTSQAIARGLRDAGVPLNVREQLSPTNLDYMAQSLGGFVGGLAPHVLDGFVEPLQKAGLFPDFNPKTAKDLGLPPDTSPAVIESYLMRLPAQDDGRPWWLRMGLVASTAGSAQSVRQKVEHLMNPNDVQRWHQTEEFWKAQELVQRDVDQRKAEILSHPERWTHEQVRQKLMDEDARRRAGTDALHMDPQFRLAIKDRRERQEFMDRLPGLPVHPEALSGALPEGTNVQALQQQYQQPPGGEGQQGMALAQARTRWLSQTAKQLGVSRGTLMDHIAGQVLQQGPAIVVPDLALEDGVDRFLHPSGTDASTAPRDLNLRRQQELVTLGQEWHATPEEVHARINARLSRPGGFSPLEVSQKRAELLHAKMAGLPAFVDRQGQPLTTSPDEAAQWTAQLETQKARLRAQHVPEEAWPQMVQTLETARRNAEVLKVKALASDPAYADYEAWYGLGRNTTVQAWNDYQAGKVPRYKSGTPEQWASWDLALKTYQALPLSSPMRAAMKPAVEQIRQRATPGWRGLLKLDESEA